MANQIDLNIQPKKQVSIWTQNDLSDNKVSVWTTNQTDISMSQILFWDTKQPDISKSVSQNTDTWVNNIFESNTVPSKDTYNYAKWVGGSVYENQKKTIWDTFQNIASKISWTALGVAGMPQLLPTTNLLNIWSKITQNKGRNTKAFWMNVAGWFETNAEETARWLSTLVWKKDLASSIKEIYAKDLETTKWWQAIEQEDIFTNIWQKDWEWMWWNVGYQVWNMMPSIFANILWWLSWSATLGKIAGWLTLFPSMFQEAYDTYAEDPNITDEQAYVWAVIAWILMSAIEQVWWLEDLTKKGWLKWLAKNIKIPILRYLSTYWIEVWAEWLEEIFQKVVMDITQWVMSGKWWQKVNSLSKLWGYVKDLAKVWAEASTTSAFMIWAPTYISLKSDIEQEKREEFTNTLLEWLAEETDTFEEFKEWAEIFDKTEEELQQIWDNQQKSQEQVEELNQKVDNLTQDVEELKDTEWVVEQEQIAEEQEEQEVAELDDIMDKLDVLEEEKTSTRWLQESITENQKISDIENIEKEQQRTNQILQQELFDKWLTLTANWWTEQKAKTKKEASIVWDKPTIVNWKYILNKSWKTQSYKWLSREEISKQYRKDSEEYRASANRVKSLTALENKLRASQNKNEKITAEDKKAIREANIPTEYKNEIISRGVESVSEWIKRIMTLKRAEKKHQAKIKNRLNNQVFNRIYRLSTEVKDDTLVWYSDFIIKHRLKNQETEKQARKMISEALFNLSKLLKTNVADIFEWCKIIFIDYQGKWRNAWWMMQWFIDWSWTPIIPISLNYVWWKESTVIHELVHGMDFIYQYRKGWATFEEKFNNTFVWDFNYTLATDLPWLLKELRKEMNNGKNATWYWKKATEIMSRVFQEYYEYTYLKDKGITKDKIDYSNTLNEPYHWKDINLVERTVNNVVDLFRAEFWLKPLDRDINNLDDFIRKTNTITQTFNNIWAYDLFDCMSNVWHQLNEKKTELYNETDVNKRKELQAQISEIENSWNLLNDWWTEFIDTMFEWYVDKKWQKQLWFVEDLKILQDTINEWADMFKSQSEWILEGRVATLDSDVKGIEELLKRQNEVNKNLKKEKSREPFKQMINFWKDLTTKVWSRLYNVDPKIAWSMNIYEWNTMLHTAQYSKRAYKFVEKAKALSANDKLILKEALFNYWDSEWNADVVKEKAKVLEIADNLWLWDELRIVFNVIEDLWNEYVSAWLKLNRRDLYFPREVKDYKWLKEYIDKTILKWEWDIEYKNEIKSLSKDIQNLQDREDITEEDRNRQIRNKLDKLNITIKKFSATVVNQKQRTITNTKDWWKEIMLYYADPEDAIINFIPHMVERIERAKFFGRGVSAEGIKWIYKKVEELWLPLTDDTKEGIRLYLMWKNEWLETLIEEWVEIWLDADTISSKLWELKWFMDKVYSEDTKNSITNMVANSNLSEEKWQELEYVLNSYFGRVWTPVWIQWVKNASYLLYLWNLTSAVTQLWDLSFSLMQWWPKNFIKWVTKNILGKAEVSVSQLWIEDLYDDFKHSMKDWTSKILNTTLKYSWFKIADIGMKQVFIQTILETMRDQAKNNPDYLNARLELLYWKDTAKELKELYEKWDIYDSEWNLNELMLIDLLYNLSATQPIMKSSATVFYNNSPVSRLAYTMKTFSLNTLDLFIHWTKRTYDIYRAMWKSKTESAIRAGSFTMYWIWLYVLFDLAVQWLKVLVNSLFWLFDKDKDTLWNDCFLYNWMNYWWETANNKLAKDVLDALWTLVFINDYSKFAWQTTWGAWIIWQLVAPPLTSFVTNVAKILLGKSNVSQLTYNIPIAWSIIYYWWWKENDYKLWKWNSTWDFKLK